MKAHQNLITSRSHSLREQIAKAVRNGMHNQGMTALELAARSGVTNTYITMVTKGEANLKLETIAKLEAGLGLSLLSVQESGEEPFQI